MIKLLHTMLSYSIHCIYKNTTEADFRLHLSNKLRDRMMSNFS